MFFDTTIEIKLDIYDRMIKDLIYFIIYLPMDEILKNIDANDNVIYQSDIKIYVKTPENETVVIFTKLKEDLGYLPLYIDMEKNDISILRYCGIDLTVYKPLDIEKSLNIIIGE